MVARVCLGRLPNGAYGLRVSKPGVDVLTANDGDLTFDSGSPFMRVIARGSMTWVFMESERVINIGTTFDYTPLVQLFIYKDPNISPENGGGYGISNTNVSVRFSGTNAIFTNEYNLGQATIRYVIYSTRAA